MKLKKLAVLALATASTLAFVSCGNKKKESAPNPDESDKGLPEEEKGQESGNNGSSAPIYGDGKTTVFLAGDSTVKTYSDNQYIGGWGQYLGDFLGDVPVQNAAQGGRSSRSFINEGRLVNNPNSTYTFSENSGHSIEDCIESGDYLFIQFGHNDDDTKSGDTLAERMVPLGTPDSNGIYPVTAGTKTNITKSGSSVTDDSVSSAVATKMSSYSSTLKSYKESSVAKYGDSYYEYSSGGTYKWFLKQYIDFARSKGATPVLVTPVARVSFESDNTTIKSGAGLHGENFAYVKAVRQLAQEEGCMLVDLFDYTKDMLQTLTKTYADYVMALKPNGLTGTWPLGYDMTYKNTELKYEGIEATHYNKYGAFLEAGYVAQAIKGIANSTKGESISFKDKITVNPKKYVDPSNMLPKALVNTIESKITGVNVKNPNRVYNSAQSVVDAINALTPVADITNANYKTVGEAASDVRKLFYGLNIDDRASVTNIETLKAIEDKVDELVEANRPKPISTEVFNASVVTEASIVNTDVTYGAYKLHADPDKDITVRTCDTTIKFNGVDYKFTKYMSFKGSKNGSYIEFNVTGPCRITVVGASGSSSAARVFGVYTTSGWSAPIAQCTAETSVGATSAEVNVSGATTLRIASTSSSVYVYGIIIEYYA